MAYIQCRELQKLSPRQKQACPFCGQLQTIMMRGKVRDLEDKTINVVGDRGYSFCNCRNIFFTDWKNIDLNVYDENYMESEGGDEGDKKVRLAEVEKQWKVAQRFSPKAKSLLNVGDYEDTFLDFLKKQDWNKMELTTIDLAPRESKHRLLQGNFESYDFGDEKFDIIWMSHVMEHYKSPKDVLLKIKTLLNPGGIFFNAMPDTHHIDWNNPLAWYWMVQEHHILWNMYDWITFAEENGFECLYQNISTDVVTIDDKSHYWINESRTIFKLA